MKSGTVTSSCVAAGGGHRSGWRLWRAGIRFNDHRAQTLRPLEMAAAYVFHIAQNQPFLDGNKRMGLVAALVFLDLEWEHRPRPA